MKLEIKDLNGLVIATHELPDDTHQSKINEIIASYVKPIKTMQQIVSEKMTDILEFSSKIKKEFIDENVMLGISQRGLTNHVRKTMREVNDAMGSGSLKDAIIEITLIDSSMLDSVVLSASRLLAFRNKIEAKLEVPFATSWNQDKTWT